MSDIEDDLEEKDPEELLKVVGEIMVGYISDPETTAWLFQARNTSGEVVSYSDTLVDEQVYVDMVAAVLVQYAQVAEASQKQFIKDVIEEYNERTKVTAGRVDRVGEE